MRKNILLGVLFGIILFLLVMSFVSAACSTGYFEAFDDLGKSHCCLKNQEKLVKCGVASGCFPIDSPTTKYLCCSTCGGGKQVYNFITQTCPHGLLCNKDEQACGNKCVPKQVIVDGKSSTVACCLSYLYKTQYEILNDLCKRDVDSYVYNLGERCCNEKKYNWETGEACCAEKYSAIIYKINTSSCCTPTFSVYINDMNESYVVLGAEKDTTTEKKAICEKGYNFPKEKCLSFVSENQERFESLVSITLDSYPEIINYLRCVSYLQNGVYELPELDLGNYKFRIKGSVLTLTENTVSIDISQYKAGEKIIATENGVNIIGTGFNFLIGQPRIYIDRTSSNNFDVYDGGYNKNAPTLYSFENLNGKVTFEQIGDLRTHYKINAEANAGDVIWTDKHEFFGQYSKTALKYSLHENGYLEKNMDASLSLDYIKLKSTDAIFTLQADASKWIKIPSEEKEKSVLLGSFTDGSLFKSGLSGISWSEKPERIDVVFEPSSAYDMAIDAKNNGLLGEINGRVGDKRLMLETPQVKITNTNGLKMLFNAQNNNFLFLNYPGVEKGVLGSIESAFIFKDQNGMDTTYWVPSEIIQSQKGIYSELDKNWMREMNKIASQPGFNLIPPAEITSRSMNSDLLSKHYSDVITSAVNTLPQTNIRFDESLQRVSLENFEGPLAEAAASAAFTYLNVINQPLVQNFKKYPDLETARAEYLKMGHTPEEIKAIELIAEYSPKLYDSPGVVRYLINQNKLDSSGIKVNKIEYLSEETGQTMEVDLEKVRVKGILEAGPRPVKAVTKVVGTILKAPFEAGEFVFKQGEKVPVLGVPSTIIKQIFRQPNTAIKHLTTGADYQFHLVSSTTKDEDGNSYTTTNVEFSRK